MRSFDLAPVARWGAASARNLRPLSGAAPSLALSSHPLARCAAGAPAGLPPGDTDRKPRRPIGKKSPEKLRLAWFV